MAGVRVICNYIEDIYRIADLLVNQNDITLVRTGIISPIPRRMATEACT